LVIIKNKIYKELELFLCVRLGEEEVYWNEVWKLQKCCEGTEVGDGDRKLGCTCFGRRFGNVYRVCLLMDLNYPQIIG